MALLHTDAPFGDSGSREAWKNEISGSLYICTKAEEAHE